MLRRTDQLCERHPPEDDVVELLALVDVARPHVALARVDDVHVLRLRGPGKR